MTGSLDLDGSSDCPISNFSPCNVVISTHIHCKKALLTRKWLLDERDVTVNFEKRKGANGKTRVSRHIRPICMLALLFILFSLFWAAIHAVVHSLNSEKALCYLPSCAAHGRVGNCEAVPMSPRGIFTLRSSRLHGIITMMVSLERLDPDDINDQQNFRILL